MENVKMERAKKENRSLEKENRQKRKEWKNECINK